MITLYTYENTCFYNAKREKKLLICLCWLNSEPCSVANYSSKIINELFWRETAGNQRVFVLSMTLSDPSEALRHASLAADLSKRANDPKARHCRLFHFTIVTGSHTNLLHQFEKQKALSLLEDMRAQKCPKLAGNKVNESRKVCFKPLNDSLL